MTGQPPGTSRKRCVYRGRGALCHTDYAAKTGIPPQRYSDVDLPRINGCSANYWCADRSQNVFNEKISRFPISPQEQNADPAFPRALKVANHTFGLGARILGRPFDYHGTLPFPSLLTRQF